MEGVILIDLKVNKLIKLKEEHYEHEKKMITPLSE